MKRKEDLVEEVKGCKAREVQEGVGQHMGNCGNEMGL